MRRPGARKRGPWEEYALAVLLEKGIEAIVELASSRITARVAEWRRHASGEAERQFVARFDEAFAGEPVLDDDDEVDSETAKKN